METERSGEDGDVKEIKGLDTGEGGGVVEYMPPFLARDNFISKECPLYTIT